MRRKQPFAALQRETVLGRRETGRVCGSLPAHLCLCAFIFSSTSGLDACVGANAAPAHTHRRSAPDTSTGAEAIGESSIPTHHVPPERRRDGPQHALVLPALAVEEAEVPRLECVRGEDPAIQNRGGGEAHEEDVGVVGDGSGDGLLVLPGVVAGAHLRGAHGEEERDVAWGGRGGRD